MTYMDHLSAMRTSISRAWQVAGVRSSSAGDTAAAPALPVLAPPAAFLRVASLVVAMVTPGLLGHAKVRSGHRRPGLVRSSWLPNVTEIASDTKAPIGTPV